MDSNLVEFTYWGERIALSFFYFVQPLIATKMILFMSILLTSLSLLPPSPKACTDPDIFDLILNKSTYCPGETITLSIVGDLNDATEWVVYINQCATVKVTSSPFSQISLGSLSTLGVTTIFVRGEGGCVGTSLGCKEIDINVTGTNPTISSLSLNQATYCPGEPISLTINGSLNDAEEWVVYVNSCGGTEVTRSSSSLINLGSLSTLGTTNIYVRGEGACINGNLACASTSIIVGGTNPVINSLSLNQADYCPGEPISLTINGSLNDAEEWVVYVNSCGGSEVTRSSSSLINLGSLANPGTVNIFVRGEGSCISSSLSCTAAGIQVTPGSLSISCANLSPAAVGPTCLNTTPDYTNAPFVSVTGSCYLPYAVSQYPSVGTQLPPGTYPVTMTVTNSVDDYATCTIDLVVNDALNPSASTSLPTINVFSIDDVPLPNSQVVTGLNDNCADCRERVWINELHYMNAGSDINEFVEVAGTAGTDLSDYKLVFFDGNTNMISAQLSLTGMIDNEANGFGAVSFQTSGIADNNGGVSLVVTGSGTPKILEFWSYGGVLLGNGAPIEGMSSTDMGVMESATGPGTASLQKNGLGTIGFDFGWSGPALASPGNLNANQTIDTCGGVFVSHVSDIDNSASGMNGDTLVITRTYEVADASGNSINIDQLIKINCNDNLNLNTVHIGSNQFQAGFQINSSSMVNSGFTQYEAQQITLNSNFSVQNNAQFQANIGGCAATE